MTQVPEPIDLDQICRLRCKACGVKQHGICFAGFANLWGCQIADIEKALLAELPYQGPV